MIGVVFEALLLILKLIVYDTIALFRLFVPVVQKSVDGKIILVTGAGHGIGRLTALKLAKNGATLVLWDINEKGNEDTAQQIRGDGGKAHTYTVNVTDKDKVKETAQRVKTDVGEVNILINNAGILVGQSILDLTDEQIIRTMNVNVMAHFWTIRAFLPDMLKADSGHIVTIASVAGYVGSAYLTDYTASKFAARGLDDALEYELNQVFNKTGIRLTCVNPFYVNTGLIERYYSRFIPTLEEDTVAEAIVDGMLRNKRHIFLPSIHGFYFRPTWVGTLRCGPGSSIWVE
ncbi:putative 17-beta-hydroxysteroid dehydrogenase 13-like [Apostichopus japonicus]|uniref:Short-chain dehydrogenase/reductase 3 n=1 Tax=Stichopus japonicus TaxID=307972 RepID=A0A2G8KWD8_STIJA|nr:putative 17-beta-hydroxysteroid dehydrogenase 13-like [Apostichopus japonicus]